MTKAKKLTIIIAAISALTIITVLSVPRIADMVKNHQRIEQKKMTEANGKWLFDSGENNIDFHVQSIELNIDGDKGFYKVNQSYSDKSGTIEVKVNQKTHMITLENDSIGFVNTNVKASDFPDKHFATTIKYSIVNNQLVFTSIDDNAMAQDYKTFVLNATFEKE
ncbi:hypothetical protein [Lactococcus lactis]|uniref:hypothetical protein n=1 Tax=Lactococcus lactis TaxID=1358 RepID=UPI00071DD52F|nr:hypothetical protein [Lactococcus lactis]KSU00189.1 hypothetical protein KF196_0191 [Lactococcus lactis subsp. lactis]